MANKPIAMNKLKQIIRLHLEGNSKLKISQRIGISRRIVRNYIKRFERLKIGYDELKELSDSQIDLLFYKHPIQEVPDRLKQLREFFPYMSKELKKPGVTRHTMFEEYIERYPDGYRMTQFYEHYRRWKRESSPVMHIEHKAGDKMYVDYAGKKLHIVDEESGEVTDVEVYVAILGASQLTYVEATLSQKKEDLITSTENALHYFEGVPAAIVSDNLKSAVKKSNRYEPTLNEAFADFAEYYGATVLPTRAYRPRDKALVEGAVKIIYTAVYARLRNETFHSLEELNEAIGILLEEHNKRKMKGRSYSRRQMFEEVERSQLRPLPSHRYELKEQSWATVNHNGHVVLQKDKHYYSVPYQYIRKKVKLMYSASKVEVYYHFKCIATHKRMKSPFNYSTIQEHLASQHQVLTKWNPEFFIKWAGDIDPKVKDLVVKILDKKQHPEQAYRSCIGILGLGKKVGKQRLINACSRSLEYGIHNYQIILKILERGLDKLDEPLPDDLQMPDHDNIRGEEYYQ